MNEEINNKAKNSLLQSNGTGTSVNKISDTDKYMPYIIISIIILFLYSSHRRKRHIFFYFIPPLPLSFPFLSFLCPPVFFFNMQFALN